MSKSNCCLGVFAKHWTPGKVKTRLGSSIGNELAAQVYRRFVETLLTRLKDLPTDLALAYAPQEQESEFQKMAPREWQLLAQAEGNLGERMERFFANRLASGNDGAAGYERVILLGTDSPNVPLEHIQQAFEELHARDAVFGPTEDGGYYLVGLSKRCPEVFAGIPWSTPEVWPTTRQRLLEAGVSFSTVPTWYDVDTLEDLNRLRGDLQATADPSLITLRNELSQLLPTDNSPASHG